MSSVGVGSKSAFLARRSRRLAIAACRSPVVKQADRMFSPCCGDSCAGCVLRLTEAPVGTGATIVDAVFGPAASGDIQYAHSPRQGGMWAKAAESIILASISMSQCKQGRDSRLSRRTHESADACTHRIQTGIRVHVTRCADLQLSPPPDDRLLTRRESVEQNHCMGVHTARKKEGALH